MNNYEFEEKLYSEGYEVIAGTDEVGRGCIAGPVVACAIIMPKNCIIEGVTDSKLLTDKKRRLLKEEIISKALAYEVIFISEEEIDRINILEASRKAMVMAINKLKIKPDYVLADAMKLPIDIPTLDIIKGDLRSHTIGCASIVAKVIRDDLMIELSKMGGNPIAPYGDKNNIFNTINDNFSAVKSMLSFFGNKKVKALKKKQDN
jgi:ribonuclease HII